MGGAKLIPPFPSQSQPCCNWDARKGDYVFPAKKKLQEYRVLITTLITASRWEVCMCVSVACVSKGQAGEMGKNGAWGGG